MQPFQILKSPDIPPFDEQPGDGDLDPTHELGELISELGVHPHISLVRKDTEAPQYLFGSAAFIERSSDAPEACEVEDCFVPRCSWDG